jgi:hypothetical protein
MTSTTYQFKFNDLDIDLKQIEKVLGYGEGSDRDIVDYLIAEILGEPDLFTEIRAEYKIYNEIEFVDSDKSLTVNNINFEIHKILSGQLRKSDSLAFFLCTAGHEPGARSRKSMADGDPLKGYIYDMLGSITVDAAADLMQAELEKSVISSGKKITNRYSPGYCGWHVSEQHKLFRLFPDNFCGIRLTDSALMDPIKSISGIIGIGKNVRYNQYTCSLCEMKECAYRELKTK